LKGHTGPTAKTVDEGLMGLYLAWLVGAGFLPQPTLEKPEKRLPVLENAGNIKAAGRSGV
jgi:L-aminoadipate-semialdehyde dehydrogenase